MAIHSSILAWRIPRIEEPGRLQSMGSQRVGHDWATFTILRWRTLREKQSFFFLGEQKKSKKPLASKVITQIRRKKEKKKKPWAMVAARLCLFFLTNHQLD